VQQIEGVFGSFLRFHKKCDVYSLLDFLYQEWLRQFKNMYKITRHYLSITERRLARDLKEHATIN
jgi:hypothetical protein